MNPGNKPDLIKEKTFFKIVSNYLELLFILFWNTDAGNMFSNLSIFVTDNTNIWGLVWTNTDIEN